jgi:hypothetical protein
MRAFEQQNDESDVAFAAYKVFRDLGPGRTLREVAAIYYDRPAYRERTRSVPSQVKKWSARFDWPGRARQRDEYVDSIKLAAVEEHELSKAADQAKRVEALREENLTNEERAASIEKKYLDCAERLIDELPLIKKSTVREEEGKPAVYIIEPATKNPVLDAQRLHKIATRSEPTKIAPTDPTGEHEYGRSAGEIEAEFEELLRSAGADPGKESEE